MAAKFFRLCVLAFGVAVAMPSAAQGAGTLYGTQGANNTTSNLLILNPANGALVSTVGPIGFAVTGLAVNPLTGQLFGSTSQNSTNSPRSLIRIDKTTGAGTLVGSLGVASQSAADITFTSDGTLYGWLEPDNDELYTINTATGAATLVGASGLDTNGSGLAANSANVLYYAGFDANGALDTINRFTGVPTTGPTMTGAPLPGESVSALAFSPAGVLYGVNLLGAAAHTAHLITIDTGTGAVTDLGTTVVALDAIVFDVGAAPVSTVVPTLSPSILAALACLLLLAGAIALHRRS